MLIHRLIMIPNPVTKKENQILTALPSLEEARAALFSINKHGAPA